MNTHPLDGLVTDGSGDRMTNNNGTDTVARMSEHRPASRGVPTRRLSRPRKAKPTGCSMSVSYSHVDNALVAEHTSTPDQDVLRGWDEVVERSGVDDVAQLSAWSDIRAAHGYEPIYVFIRQGDRLVAGAQILCRRVPVLGTIGYLPYGPVIAPDVDPRDQVTRQLAAKLSKTGRQLRMLFVQPPVGAEDVSASLLDAGFRPSDALIAPRASVRLDITPPEEELVARLPRRLRTWTRQWSKRGVRVRVGNAEDVARFAELLDNTAAHHRFNPHSEEYLRMQYDTLASRGNAVLLIGEANGRPVAGELFTACGTVVTTRLCGLDRDAETLKLNVASAVTWEGIRWAKANGYHTVDFGGFKSASLQALDANPEAETRALAGPDQAKLKFGGEVVRYPEAVEIISSPVARFLYDAARRHPIGRRVVAGARTVLRGTISLRRKRL